MYLFVLDRTYVRLASANHLILMPIAAPRRRRDNIDITYQVVGALPCLEAGKT